MNSYLYEKKSLISAVLDLQNIRGTCLLSYSYSSTCPSEKEAFYLSEAKKSFEIGLLTKKNQELVTSKQELHSFVKAVFCLSKVHQRLYGESETLSQVNQLCKEALEKLYAYSHSTKNKQQDKGQLAKDIMGLVMSAKEQLHVQGFPNSDAMSYIPDSYKTHVNKPIVNSELSFEKVLKMHSQHHEAVCDIFESACRNSKVRFGEGNRGACITTLKTETRNTDTMCMTEERSHRGSDAAINPVTEKVLKHYEVHKAQIQKELSQDAAVDVSLGEETESEPSERNKSHSDDFVSSSKSGSAISSSLKSWSKCSGSSFFTCWEDVEDELSQDKVLVLNTKGWPEKDQACSAAFSEGVLKNAEESDLCWLSSKIHQVSLQETQHDCTYLVNHSLQNNREMKLEPNDRHLEGAVDVTKQSHKEAKSSNSKISHDNLNPRLNLIYEHDPFGIFSSVVDSRAKNNTENSWAISKHNQCISRNENSKDPEFFKTVVEPAYRNHYPMVAPEGETLDAAKGMKPHHNDNKGTTASIDSSMPKLEHDNYIQSWINKSIYTSPRRCSCEIPEVDSQAETAEDWEFASSTGGKSKDHLRKLCMRQDQESYFTSFPSGRDNKLPVYANQSIDCATTEEDEGEKTRNILNSSLSSSSSLKSWYKAPSFSRSFSELGTPSLLNSSASSFVFIERTKEQILKARLLSNDEYSKLLSGVEHDWLMQRMKNLGLFKPNLLHQAYCK